MRQIRVTVRNRVAEQIGRERYVCGNNDYAIVFDFDTEWAAYDVKTARFVTGRRYVDVVFNGDVCPVPVLNNVTMFKVGVFAGDIRTTTPAQVPALKSILDDGGCPLLPPTDVYAQIMEKLNTLQADVNDTPDSAGIQADWNVNDETNPAYIKNRPFYSEIIEEEALSITWDGNTEGLEQTESGGYYKISDLVLTESELVGATYTNTLGGIVEEYVIAAPGTEYSSGTFRLSTNEYGCYLGDAGFAFVNTPGGGVPAGWGGPFPSAGIWATTYDVPTTLTLNENLVKERVHKLDDKYLSASPSVLESKQEVLAGKQHELESKQEKLAGKQEELQSKQETLQSKQETLEGLANLATLRSYRWAGNGQALNSLTTEHCQRSIKDGSSEILCDWYKISEDVIEASTLDKCEVTLCNHSVSLMSESEFLLGYGLVAALEFKPLIVFANGATGESPYFPSQGIWTREPAILLDYASYVETHDLEFPVIIRLVRDLGEVAQLAETASTAVATLEERLAALEETVAALTAE